MIYQNTIAKEVKFEGVGLHTGAYAKLRILPAKPDTGIVFQFTNDSSKIKVDIENVYDTSKRGTTLSCNGRKIYTVEHILSALYGLRIDNALIEINNKEIPILDGSNKEYVEKILNAGVKTSNIERNFLIVDQPIEIEEGDSKIGIYPYNGLKITFEIDFKNKSIGKQKFVLKSLKQYKSEISTSRTFCTFNDILDLKEKGLAIGGNLDNAIIYIDDSTSIEEIKEFNESNSLQIKKTIDKNITNINNKKLLFDNEAVRHKILDLIGDLALLGKDIKGHIISYKGGHAINIKLMEKIKLLYSEKKSFKYNREAIKKIIPHRDPFLLIDEIIDFKHGEYVHAVKYVNKNENYFQGHFPDTPILPGVLIIECMAQASCFLSLSTVDSPNQKLMLLSVIKSAKFLKTVIPGDILNLEITLLKFKMNNALIKGIGTVNGEKVAEAEWMATVVDKKK